MARYSRRRGPAADFELAVADAVIPGLSITRSYDDGELLILAHARFQNDQAVNVTGTLVAFLDGLQTGLRSYLFPNPPAGTVTLTLIAFATITAGLHTIDLRATGSAAANDFIVANTAELTVIQLPLWDSDADIT